MQTPAATGTLCVWGQISGVFRAREKNQKHQPQGCGEGRAISSPEEGWDWRSSCWLGALWASFHTPLFTSSCGCWPGSPPAVDAVSGDDWDTLRWVQGGGQQALWRLSGLGVHCPMGLPLQSWPLAGHSVAFWGIPGELGSARLPGNLRCVGPSLPLFSNLSNPPCSPTSHLHSTCQPPGPHHCWDVLCLRSLGMFQTRQDRRVRSAAHF